MQCGTGARLAITLWIVRVSKRVSKAPADKTQLMIFEVISAKVYRNCSEIVVLQGVTPATVSHHPSAAAKANSFTVASSPKLVKSTHRPLRG